MAYTVGLVASDGCLQKDGRHIDLTSKDRDQLINFSLALGRDLKISKKLSGQGKSAYRVQFGDVVYYDFLLGAGLTPAKSKTIRALTIPDEFYADFLLGLFDGDGSCYGYMDRRWQSSFMFYTSFASASLPFVQYLQQNNRRLIGTSQGSIRWSKRAFSLVYAKMDSHLLFKYIYYQGHITSLSRKKIKLENFVRKDQLGIISKD